MPHRISIRVLGKWVSPITAIVREVGATSGSLMDIETSLRWVCVEENNFSEQAKDSIVKAGSKLAGCTTIV